MRARLLAAALAARLAWAPAGSSAPPSTAARARAGTGAGKEELGDSHHHHHHPLSGGGAGGGGARRSSLTQKARDRFLELSNRRRHGRASVRKSPKQTELRVLDERAYEELLRPAASHLGHRG